MLAEKVGVTWKENFLLAGDALGERAEAQRILADYEQKAKQVGQQFGDPDDLWYLGIEPIAADLVLDDMKGHATS